MIQLSEIEIAVKPKSINVESMIVLKSDKGTVRYNLSVKGAKELLNQLDNGSFQGVLDKHYFTHEYASQVGINIEQGVSASDNYSRDLLGDVQLELIQGTLSIAPTTLTEENVIGLNWKEYISSNNATVQSQLSNNLTKSLVVPLINIPTHPNFSSKLITFKKNTKGLVF